MRKLETPNYWEGRGGYGIQAGVIHITDGSKQSAINTFLNPESFVSAHKLIAPDEVIEFVKPEDTAWHAGLVVSPTWVGLQYAQFGGGDRLKEYTGSNRGEQGEVIQPAWDRRLGSFKNVINPNFYTYAWEIISKGEFPNWNFWVSTAKIIKADMDSFGLPLDSLHLVNHNEIRRNKECPGFWFQRSFIQVLNKIYV